MPRPRPSSCSRRPWCASSTPARRSSSAAATTTRPSGSGSRPTSSSGPGLHLRTSLADVGRPVVVGDTAVHPLPYLEPALAADALGADRAHPRRRAAGRHGARACRCRARGGRTVVMAHAFVTGGVTSESERDISRRRRRRRCRRRSSPGSTTPRWGTCTAARRSHPACATAAPPSRCRSPSGSTARAAWLVDLGPAHPGGRAPRGPGRSDRWRCCAAPSTTCWPTGATRAAETAWCQVTLTDAAAPARGDGPGAAPLPAHPGAALRPAGCRGAAAAVRRAGRHRHRPRGLLRLPRPRARRPRAPATPSGRCSPRPSRPPGSPARSATTRASWPAGRWAPREGAPARDRGVRAVRRPGRRRRRRALGRGALPHPRPHRGGQDEPARRHLLRPVRRRPGLPVQARAAQRPRRARMPCRG